MDQMHVLRHQVLNEGRSIRRVARELGISRNTVAKYLEQSEPVRRRGRPRGRPVWEAVSCGCTRDRDIHRGVRLGRGHDHRGRRSVGPRNRARRGVAFRSGRCTVGVGAQ
jgi:DNA-binding transcriptional MocR family regulator